MNSSDISSNANLLVPNATLYEFGVLTSQMHMAWMRTVCGRLKSDYRYSAQIVYNNFPWPDVSEEQKAAIMQKAQAVLDARSQFPDSSLADLYDPNTMPPVLTKAHAALDSAVDKLYWKAALPDDTSRVAFLFELYGKKTERLLTGKRKLGRGRGCQYATNNYLRFRCPRCSIFLFRCKNILLIGLSAVYYFWYVTNLY